MLWIAARQLTLPDSVLARGPGPTKLARQLLPHLQAELTGARVREAQFVFDEVVQVIDLRHHYVHVSLNTYLGEHDRRYREGVDSLVPPHDRAAARGLLERTNSLIGQLANLVNDILPGRRPE